MVSDARFARDVSKQLLADALAQEASAAKMFESASKMFESMRDNLDEARDKVRAAEAVLEETEEKWPEIVIDDEASTASPPSKERQKLAASSTGGIAMPLQPRGVLLPLQLSTDQVMLLSASLRLSGCGTLLQIFLH
jgi:hypothetical protein